MKYFVAKNIPSQIKKLNQAGGPYQKAASKVKEILGGISMKEKDPLRNIPKTKHGENRIKHCVKYQ